MRQGALRDCACQARQQAIAVVWDGIAAPAHVLIGADQRKACAVSRTKPGIVWDQEFQRNPARLCGGMQRMCAGGIAVGREERESWTEVIVERGAVVEPQMRCEAPRVSRR